MNDLAHHRKMQARIDELGAQVARLSDSIAKLEEISSLVEMKLCQCDPPRKKS